MVPDLSLNLSSQKSRAGNSYELDSPKPKITIYTCSVVKICEFIPLTLRFNFSPDNLVFQQVERKSMSDCMSDTNHKEQE